MRRFLPLAVALLSLPGCRTGGRRGAPTPTADSGPVVTADDGGGSLGAARTDRLAIVPNLVGLNERDAAAFAQRAGFDVVPLVVPGQPAGVVLSQERVAGREAPVGTPIGIRVASGRGVASAPFARGATTSVPAAPPAPTTPPTPADMTTPRPEGPAVAAGNAPFVTPTDRGVVVPPVLDRTPEQARRILEDAGLRCREEVASGGIPGRVMDQDPPAGARRPAGTEIVVRIPAPPAPPPPSDAPPAAPSGETAAPPPVAVAPAKVVVPSVLDKTEAVARRILEDLGLVVRGEPTASGVSGHVMDQLPSPGTTVEAGSSVVIRIPGLAVAEPAAPAKPDDSAPIPATEFGSPDAAPSIATAPRPPTPDVAAPPAVPTPEAPAVPPVPPAPPPAPPVVAPTPEAPAVPPVSPVVVAPPVVELPPAVEPPPAAPEPDVAEPIFASPRRGSTPEASPGAEPSSPVDGDRLPPPPPPAVLTPPPPAPEPVMPEPAAPGVPAPEVPAIPPPPPESDAGSALPPPPPTPAVPPPAPAPVPDAPTPASPADSSALPIPTLRAPLDDASFKLAPRVVVEVAWSPVAGATGYLLEVEEVADGGWVAVERRVVKGAKAVVDLETVAGRATDFRWRVRTVVGRRGGKPSAWAVFHAR